MIVVIVRAVSSPRTGRPRKATVCRVGVALVVAVVLMDACSSDSGSPGTTNVIGSFYPLAWAAQSIGGSAVSVTDLTPPGVEAHDTNLNARQVAQIESADVVLILGYLGFQPQVEAAAHDAGGDVVELTRGFDLRSSNEQGLSADPHVWLDPVLMARM